LFCPFLLHRCECRQDAPAWNTRSNQDVKLRGKWSSDGCNLWCAESAAGYCSFLDYSEYVEQPKLNLAAIVLLGQHSSRLMLGILSGRGRQRRHWRLDLKMSTRLYRVGNPGRPLTQGSGSRGGQPPEPIAGRCLLRSGGGRRSLGVSSPARMAALEESTRQDQSRQQRFRTPRMRSMGRATGVNGREKAKSLASPNGAGKQR